MRWLHKISLRFKSLFRKSRVEHELSDELRFHLEGLIKEKISKGIKEEDARYAALRELGGEDQIKEECRDIRRVNPVEDLVRDIRFGLRQLRRSPGFTAIAVLTLALGIGANTTIFSFISCWLFRKPPVHSPDRVMELVSKNPNPVWDAQISEVSAPDFLDWRSQGSSYTDLAASSNAEFTLSGGITPERVSGLRVTANYFRVLGVQPLLGRTFAPGDDQAGHPRTAILSESLWRRAFGADRGVIGRTAKIDGEACVVIGVMPADFQIWAFGEQLWTPLVFTADQTGPAGRSRHFLNVIGRLRPGVQEQQARVELATIAGRLAQSRPDTNKGWGANVLSLQEYMIEENNTTTPLVFLMATVAAVLLIACANLANLLLARNSSRLHEFTVRAALGASRMRLARQLLSECLMLAVVGGGLGWVLAAWGLHLLRSRLNWSEYAIGLAGRLSMDWRVLLFTIAVSVGAALVFGLAPAIRISRPDLNSGLKESSRSTTGGRERNRLQRMLVVGELAVSMVLLVSAGLFAKSFVEEMRVKLGFDPRNTLTASVSLSGTGYESATKQSIFFQEVLRRLETYPEVRAAAVTSDLPYTFPNSVRFALEGRPVTNPDERPAAGYFTVSPGYFGAVRIPLRGGRAFTPSDNSQSPPVAIIDEAFAQKYFPKEDPLGRRLSIDGHSSAEEGWSEIVGVVGNVNEFTGQRNPRPHLFVPFLQHLGGSMSLVVRVGTEPAAFASSLRQAVWAVDKDTAVTSVRTMDRVVLDSLQGDDLMVELMSVFAGIALTMAAVGMYGLLAYLVGQRTHEIGIRMALGARRGEILRMIIRNTMLPIMAGIAIGFTLSLGLPSLFAASFTGYHVHAAWVLAGIPVLVTIVALASCAIPALRAAKVDPVTALRYE
jgi:putative ABC transport system permease protein